MGIAIRGGTAVGIGQRVEITVFTCNMPAGAGLLALSAAAQNGACNGILALANGGKVRLRAGTTPLAEATLENPAFSSSSDGFSFAEGLPITTAPAVGAGDVDNYQLLDAGNNVIFTDLQVTAAWVVPGFGTSLALDLLADNYAPGETGDTLAVQDWSGNDRHAIQPVTAVQPTPTEGAVDGKLGIVHTGTAQDHLWIPGLDTFASGLNVPFSFGLYWRPIHSSSNGAIISWGNSASANGYLMIQAPQHTSAKYQVTRRTDNGTNDGGTTVADATEDDAAILYTFDGSTGRIWVNGVQGTFSDSEHGAPIMTVDRCVLGAWFSNGVLDRFWTAAWRRINLWSGALSAEDIANWNANVRLH